MEFFKELWQNPHYPSHAIFGISGVIVFFIIKIEYSIDISNNKEPIRDI